MKEHKKKRKISNYTRNLSTHDCQVRPYDTEFFVCDRDCCVEDHGRPGFHTTRWRKYRDMRRFPVVIGAFVAVIPRTTSISTANADNLTVNRKYFTLPTVTDVSTPNIFGIHKTAVCKLSLTCSHSFPPLKSFRFRHTHTYIPDRLDTLCCDMTSARIAYTAAAASLPRIAMNNMTM